ncbi:MAG: hypothetical protein ACR2H1_04110, partial [Limisphaerales bacterium]
GRQPISRAVFYENGKLKFFQIHQPQHESLSFKENGDLENYDVKLEDGKEQSVRVDESGKIHIKGDGLAKP